MHSPRDERKQRELFSVKWNYFRISIIAAASVMLVTLLGAYALACSYVYLAPSLPSTQAMRTLELQVPLRVYTRTGALIAQIGEQRRTPATYDQIPELVKRAFLAAEDRSEEPTSELQSQSNLVCRLLLEKKKRLIDT